MMVISLQLPFQSPRLDGVSSKATSMDSDAIQSLSFGEILKAKEKQLQQEQAVSASSVAAALATLQTLLMTTPAAIPEIDAGDVPTNVDSQSGTPTASARSSISTSGDGFSQLAAPMAGTTDQPEPPATASEKSIPSELSNTLVGSPTMVTRSVFIADPRASFSKSTEAKASAQLTNKHIANQPLKTIVTPELETGATPVNHEHMLSENLPDPITFQSGKSVPASRTVELPRSLVSSNTEPTTLSATAEQAGEKVFQQPVLPTSVDSKSSTQTLSNSFVSTQAEAKDTTIDRETSEETTDKASSSTRSSLSEINEQKTSTEVTPSRTLRTETSVVIEDRPAVEIKTSQDTRFPVPEQKENPTNIPSPMKYLPDGESVEFSQDQRVTDQVRTFLQPERFEQPVNADALKEMAVNQVSVQPLSVPTKFDEEDFLSSSNRVETSQTAALPSSTQAVQISEEASVETVSWDPEKADMKSVQDMDETIEQSVNSSGRAAHTDDVSPMQPSFTSHVTNDVAGYGPSQEVDTIHSMPLPTMETPDAAPVEYSDEIGIPDIGMGSFASEIIENPVNVDASTTEASETATVFSSGAQSTMASENVPPTSIRIEDKTTYSFQVQPARDKPELNTSPFEDSQAEDLTGTLISSDSQSKPVPIPDTNRSSVQKDGAPKYIPQNEMPVPDTVSAQTKEFTFGVDTPAITMPFSSATTEVEPKFVINQVVGQNETSINYVDESTNIANLIQFETAQDNDAMEIKSLEDQADKSTAGNLVSQFAAPVEQDSGKITLQSQQVEVSAPMGQFVKQEIEKTVSVSTQPKTSPTTSADLETDVFVVTSNIPDVNLVGSDGLDKQRTMTGSSIVDARVNNAMIDDPTRLDLLEDTNSNTSGINQPTADASTKAPDMMSNLERSGILKNELPASEREQKTEISETSQTVLSKMSTDTAVQGTPATKSDVSRTNGNGLDEQLASVKNSPATPLPIQTVEIESNVPTIINTHIDKQSVSLGADNSIGIDEFSKVHDSAEPKTFEEIPVDTNQIEPSRENPVLVDKFLENKQASIGNATDPKGQDFSRTVKLTDFESSAEESTTTSLSPDSLMTESTQNLLVETSHQSKAGSTISKFETAAETEVQPEVAPSNEEVVPGKLTTEIQNDAGPEIDVYRTALPQSSLRQTENTDLPAVYKKVPESDQAQTISDNFLTLNPRAETEPVNDLNTPASSQVRTSAASPEVAITPENDETELPANTTQSRVDSSPAKTPPVMPEVSSNPSRMVSKDKTTDILIGKRQSVTASQDQPVHSSGSVVDAVRNYMSQEQPSVETNVDFSKADLTASTDLSQPATETVTDPNIATAVKLDFDKTITRPQANVSDTETSVEVDQAVTNFVVEADAREVTIHPKTAMSHVDRQISSVEYPQSVTESSVTKPVDVERKIIFETEASLHQESTGTQAVESQRHGNAVALNLDVDTNDDPNVTGDYPTTSKDMLSTDSLEAPENTLLSETVANATVSIAESESSKPQAASLEVAKSAPSTFAASDGENPANEVKVNVQRPMGQQLSQVANPAAIRSTAPSLKSTAETVQIQNVERSASTDAFGPAVTTATTEPTERADNEDAPRVSASDPGFTFVGPRVNLDQGQVASGIETENLSNQLPLSSTIKSESPLSSQSVTSVKIETDKQILKNKPAISKEEETLPTEKQPKPEKLSTVAATTAGPLRGTMTMDVNQPVQHLTPQAAEIVQQVIHQMNVKIKNGPSSMHLQLNPKELGAIDVEMVSTSQGVQVTFFAEQSNTGKLLETQLNQLRESLVDSGVQLSSLNISQQSFSEQKGGNYRQDTTFTQFPQSNRPRSEVNSNATPPPGRTTGQSSEVDYLI